MEPRMLRRSNRSLTDDDIEKWQRRASLEQPTIEEKSVVSRLYGSLSLFYQAILHSLAVSPGPLSKSTYRRLESGYTGLLAWAGDYGVEDGKLDVILDTSQKLRNLTIKIMVGICGTLIEELLPLLRLEPEDSAQKILSQAAIVEEAMGDAFRHIQASTESADNLSDAGDDTSTVLSDASPEDLLEDVVASLKNDVECLMDLGPRFEEPVKDISADEKPAEADLATTNCWDPVQLFRGRIKAKFPQCDESLVKALSQANYDATIRLHTERARASSAVAISTSLAVPGQQAANLNSGDNRTVFDDSGLGTSLPATSQLPISLQGSSMASTSSYAPTVVSFGEDGTTRTRIPPQPKSLKVGEPFPCTACGKQVVKSSSIRAWKRHLLSDCRPWICCQVSCHCKRIPYSTREEWVKHLQAQHLLHPDWDDKKCPFCAEVVPAGRAAMITHVEHHLQEISLAALPGGADEEEDTTSECSEFEGRETEPPASSSMQKPVEMESIQDHPVYKSAAPRADGLWHCPWEGEDYCNHEPSMDRSDFNKSVESHLEDFRCKVQGCERSGRAFATKESLRLHEQEAHGMQKGGDRPYLCTSSGCGRSIPGNGFADPWVRERHIKEVHGNLDLPPLDADHDTLSSPPPRPGTPGQKRKRKESAGEESMCQEMPEH